MAKLPDKILSGIINDKTSGSAGIGLKLNSYIRNNYKSRAKVKAAVEAAEANLSHFSAVENYISKLNKILVHHDENLLKEFTLSYEEDILSRYLKIYKKAKPYIKKFRSILTFSNSFTLVQIIKLLHEDNKKLSVAAAESRPKYEGRILAGSLVSSGIKVELITDAMMSLYIPKVNAVFLGADQILRNGNIVNKAGSISAALLCMHYKIPCYAFATKDKMSRKLKFKPGKENPAEVWNHEEANLQITNIYFEEVERKLITRLFTD